LQSLPLLSWYRHPFCTPILGTPPSLPLHGVRAHTTITHDKLLTPPPCPTVFSPSRYSSPGSGRAHAWEIGLCGVVPETIGGEEDKVEDKAGERRWRCGGRPVGGEDLTRGGRRATPVGPVGRCGCVPSAPPVGPSCLLPLLFAASVPTHNIWCASQQAGRLPRLSPCADAGEALREEVEVDTRQTSL
jgi:hypothetical protein